MYYNSNNGSPPKGESPETLAPSLRNRIEAELGTTVRVLATHTLAHGSGPARVVVVERTPLPAPHAIRQRFGLTPREIDVAHLLSDRFPNQRIADRLGISIHTVRRHVEHILQKLGVTSRYDVGPTLSRHNGTG